MIKPDDWVIVDDGEVYPYWGQVYKVDYACTIFANVVVLFHDGNWVLRKFLYKDIDSWRERQQKEIRLISEYLESHQRRREKYRDESIQEKDRKE